MKVSRGTVLKMPKSRPSEVLKRIEAERVLLEAQSIKDYLDAQIDGFKKREGIELRDLGNKTIEAKESQSGSGQAGEEIFTTRGSFSRERTEVSHGCYFPKDPARGTIQREEWSVSITPDESCYQITHEGDEYLRTKVVVTQVNGEKVYELTKGGPLRAGLNAARDAIGGVFRAIL